MVVVSGNGKRTNPRPWDAVDKRQDVFQAPVVVQEVASMNEQVELRVGSGAADLFDLRAFPVISPAKVRIGYMENPQSLVGQAAPIAHEPHSQLLRTYVERFIQQRITAESRAGPRNRAKPCQPGRHTSSTSSAPVISSSCHLVPLVC